MKIDFGKMTAEQVISVVKDALPNLTASQAATCVIESMTSNEIEEVTIALNDYCDTGEMPKDD